MKWTANDIITTDKYLLAFPHNYHQTDVFYGNQTVYWRGMFHTPPSTDTTLIVSGHADYPVTYDIAHKYPNTIWFSVNKQIPIVHGIPLGITNNTIESRFHSIYGNVDVMVDVANKPREIRNLVYMNFAVHTYPIERTHVWNTFLHKPWITAEHPENSMQGRRRFLQNARNHSFVLCPRGNGVDTHRLWETLYMGSIPIVIRDIAHSDWTDLPILFVDSWEEVTEERLRNELVRIQNAEWNMEKLLIGYWINRIRNESGNNSHCN